MRRLKVFLQPAWWPVVLWLVAVVGWVAFATGAMDVLLLLAAQLMLLSVFLTLVPHPPACIKTKTLRLVLYVAGAATLLMQLVTLIYYLFQRIPLDPFILLDGGEEIIPAITQTFSMAVVVGSLGALFVVWMLLCFCMVRLKSAVHLRHKSKYGAVLWMLPAAILLGWGIWTPVVLFKAVVPVIQSSRMGEDMDRGLRAELKGKMKKDVGAMIRNFDSFKSVDGAPLFILQLESVNALAVNGRANTRGRMGPEDLMPEFYGARAEGVMVPFMWGATMQTHRGQGAILCSSIMDRFAGISYTKDRLLPGCLPEMLKKDGYKTVFISAYPDGRFASTDRMMAAAGFEELHFADKMRAGDLQHEWGYDDCATYNRYFDYLDKRYGESMNSYFMAYFEVSANHDPFVAKGRYAKFEPFPNGRTIAEKYLNSYAAQDHCIAVFLDRLRHYRENAHVIIVADHSWPVGINIATSSFEGATSDNFLIPFLYLPPLKRADEFRQNVVIKSPILGQVDIFPTVLELLSGKPYSNSFAALLRNPPEGQRKPSLPSDYDDCQVMTQPYDGTQVSVARGMDKYTFNLSTGKLVHTILHWDYIESAARPMDVSDDMKSRDKDKKNSKKPSKEVMEKKMTFPVFLDQYLCSRYRYWEQDSNESFRTLPLVIEPWVF